MGSTSHTGEDYDQMLLCVCRLSGYLIAIHITNLATKTTMKSQREKSGPFDNRPLGG